MSQCQTVDTCDVPGEDGEGWFKVGVGNRYKVRSTGQESGGVREFLFGAIGTRHRAGQGDGNGGLSASAPVNIRGSVYNASRTQG